MALDHEEKYNKLLEWISGIVNVGTTQLISSQDPALSTIAPYVGTTFQTIISDIGSDIISRSLSIKEQSRIGKAFYFALKKINDNATNSKPFRDDDFSKYSSESLSEASEFLEAVLIDAQKEYQEKKIKFLGNLYANSLFKKEFDKHWLFYFLKLSESLSFRQLCYIAVLKDKPMYGLDRKVDIQKDSYAIMRADQRYELYQMILPNIIKGPTEFNANIAFPIEWYNIDWVGEQLFELMNLNEIEQEDIHRYAGYKVK